MMRRAAGGEPAGHQRYCSCDPVRPDVAGCTIKVGYKLQSDAIIRQEYCNPQEYRVAGMTELRMR